jgi:hypothetical protein
MTLINPYIEDNELKNLLIQNLPPKIKGGNDKESSNITTYPTNRVLQDCIFMNFNTKESISFMIFDIDRVDNISAREYFRSIDNFLDYIMEYIGLEPTYITETTKGYHFAYHLKNWVFTYQPKALNYLKTIKYEITKLLKCDITASHRLYGVWRNPLLHNNYYSYQINYELKDFNHILPINEEITKPQTDSKKRVFVNIDNIKEGNRNQELFKAGMRYANTQSNISKDSIYQYLVSINNKITNPLKDTEINTISKSVYGYYQRDEIDKRFGTINTKKDIDEGAMNFSKIKNLSNKEYKQETKKRQSLSAQRTLKIRDKDKNRQQIKIARKEYIEKKYKEYEIAINKALEHFKQNNMKINVSQIAKFTEIDRRMVKKIMIPLNKVNKK